MEIRFRAAMLAGKAAILVLQKWLKRGTNTPGVIMEKLCPHALARFQLPPLVICVTGTNGKTGTANLVTHLLRQSGKTVCSNSAGSNMVPGLLTALAERATLAGRVKADAAVLEVDERSSPYIYPYLTPDYLLCTNLFRDSIKRNGHSEYIFHKIDDYLPPETTLLLCGNDAVSGLLGDGRNKQVYFAVQRTAQSTGYCVSRVCDCLSCPRCHRPLHYDFYHYHHIGAPRCDCGFSMPQARYFASDVDFEAGTFCWHGENEQVTLPFSGGNLFNVFNTTAAVGVCRMAGVPLDTLAAGVASFGSAKGRFEVCEQGGRRTVTMLCKNQNPVSSSRSFSYLEHVSGTKDVVLLITDSKDKEHGHEDISWLYDTDFELLTDPAIHRIVIGGRRCRDVALRLTLAGVPEDKLALFDDYEALITAAPALTDPAGTTVIYFELYAMTLAGRVRRALTETGAKQ